MNYNNPPMVMLGDKTSKEQKLNNIPNLDELNSLLPEQEHIKIMLLLFSKFSPKSGEILKGIPDMCRKFFYYLCIDNKAIRDRILNSESIKVSQVPCIILITNNNIISTYEGDRSKEIIMMIYNIINKNNKKIEPNISEDIGATSLNDILPNNKDIHEEEFYKSSKKINKRNVEELQVKNHRTKVKNINRPMMMQPLEEDRPEPSNIGMSSVRSYPIKGIGHSKLAHSSLKTNDEDDDNEEEEKLEPIDGGEMLEELDDILDEFETDQNIDPIIKSSIRKRNNQDPKIDKKESMNSVKKMAEDMKRMRESEDTN